MARFSIRQFLTRHLIGWTFVMTAVPAYLVYMDALNEVDALFDASLVQTAKVLNGIITRKAVEENKEHIEDALLSKDFDLTVGEQHHHYEKKLSFQVWDDSGLVVKSLSAPNFAFAHFEEGFHHKHADGHYWTSFAIYSEFDNWWVVVGERSDIRRELAFDISVSHVLPIIVFIPLLLFLVSITLKKGFIRLDIVRDEVAEREYKNLELIDNEESPSEVAGLVDSLNDLLERLRSAYDRESQFVSNVAHELRTPLAGLLVNTENLLEDAKEAELAGDLADMKKAIMRLSHLVSQLLASSRSQQEFSEEQLETVDMAGFCAELIRELQKSADAKNQILQSDLQACSIRANSSMLRSILFNLIDNAIRYTPQGGQISVNCRIHGAGMVLVTVEDSGEGIPPELYEEVKQRFYRVDPSVSDGTGLGLSIVQNVVDNMHWQWELAESELGGLKHEILCPQA